MSKEVIHQLFKGICQSLDPAVDRQTTAIVRGLEAVAVEINSLNMAIRVVPDQLRGALELLVELKETLEDQNAESP